MAGILVWQLKYCHTVINIYEQFQPKVPVLVTAFDFSVLYPLPMLTVLGLPGLQES